MNRRGSSTLIAALILAALGALGLAQSDQYNKYLGAVDVQKVAGSTGIKLVPKSPDAEGDLNFAGKDGQLLLSASFYPASSYASARSSKGGFKSSVSGVGEEAFVGPATGPSLFILAFRKGLYTVVLNTELDAKSAPRLPMEKIIAIAKIIAARM
jgi:hypothetical protein